MHTIGSRGDPLRSRRNVLVRAGSVVLSGGLAIFGVGRADVSARWPAIYGSMDGTHLELADIKGEGFTPGGEVRIIAFIPSTGASWYQPVSVIAAGPNGRVDCTFDTCVLLGAGEFRAHVPL